MTEHYLKRIFNESSAILGLNKYDRLIVEKHIYVKFIYNVCL